MAKSKDNSDLNFPPWMIMLFLAPLLFVFFVDDFFDRCGIERVRKYEWHHVVNRVYLDSSNRLYKKIYLVNVHSGEAHDVNIDSDTTDFFEIVKEGDTLIKSKNSLEVKVIRDSTYFWHKLKFNCE